MNIIAKRLRVIYKTGRTFEYSHVTGIATLGAAVMISGERDGGKGTRITSTDTHLIKKLVTMDVDWYVPLGDK